MELCKAIKLLKHHIECLNGKRLAEVKPKVLSKAISVILKEAKGWDTFKYFGDEPLSGEPLKALEKASKKSGKTKPILKVRK